MAGETPVTATQSMSDSLLATIFGENWQNMLTKAAGDGGDVTSMIGGLFSVFNSAVMAVTALIVMVVMASAVVQSAHEGEPLGRRYSTIWVPLRIGTSAFLMAPVWGGFAMIQVIVMAFAGLSINIANDAANKMLAWAKEGRPMIVAPAPIRNPTELLHGVIQIELCKQYQEKYNNTKFTNTDPMAVYKFKKKSVVMEAKPFKGVDGNTLVYGYDRPVFSVITSGVQSFFDNDNNAVMTDCGSMKITCDASSTPSTCTAFLRNIQNNLSAVPNIVKGIIEDKEGKDGENRNTKISTLYLKYKGSVETLQSDALTALNPDNGLAGTNPAINKFEKNMKDKGWISVGTWYWDLTSINQKFYKSSSFATDFKPPDIELIDPNAEKMGGYNEVKKKVQKAFEGIAMKDGALGSGDSFNNFEPPKDFGGLNKIMGSIAADLLQTASGLDAQNGMKEDPVQRLMGTGHTIINTISFAYIIANVSPIRKIAGKAAKVDEKTGGGIASDAAGLIGMIVIILFIIGLAFAFYIPAIPAIVWTMAVAGWLVLLAQSMVAAPLWAAAHAMPEGEGFAGERAKQGYMLLMNVAIRPILLVIGFVLAMGMVWASVWMSQILMTSALESMLMAHDVTPFSEKTNSGSMSWGGTGAYVGNFFAQLFNVPSMLFGTIAIFVIGSVVSILLIHRSFDLIYETADDVMKWIGGSSGPLGGENQNTQKALTMIAGQFNRIEQRALGGRMQKPQKDVPGGGDTNTPAADPAKKEDVPNSKAPHSDVAGGDQGKTSKGTGG